MTPSGRVALAPQVAREPCTASAQRASGGGRGTVAACSRLLGHSGRRLFRLQLAAPPRPPPPPARRTRAGAGGVRVACTRPLSPSGNGAAVPPPMRTLPLSGAD